jgi:hypothetical protein
MKSSGSSFSSDLSARSSTTLHDVFRYALGFQLLSPLPAESRALAVDVHNIVHHGLRNVVAVFATGPFFIRPHTSTADVLANPDADAAGLCEHANDQSLVSAKQMDLKFNSAAKAFVF